MLSSSPFSLITYRRLFIAQVISLAGTGITTIALALLAWDLAGNQAGRVLGTALAIKMIAYVVLAPLAGSLAHKLPRRQWLIGLDLIRAPLVLYLPFLSELWEIYLFLFIINGCSAAFTPVFQATIADIVTDETQYQKALSYSRMAYDLEQLLSPTLAAMLLAAVSFSGLFVMDSISFLVSAGMIYFSAIPINKGPDRTDRFLKNLQFGITAYLKTPRLRSLLALYVAVACASSMMITGTVVYVIDILKKGESATALAMAISGGGSMLIALFLPNLLKHIQIRHSLRIGALILVAGMFLTAFEPEWAIFLCIWFFLGAGLSLVQVPAGSLVRMSCHHGDSIAYFSANFSLSHLCWLIAYPLAGFTSAQYGLQTAFLFMGTISAIAAGISWKLSPNQDEAALQHTHRVTAHKHYNEHDSHHQHIEQPDNAGDHLHTHKAITHKHKYVIDQHHTQWP